MSNQVKERFTRRSPLVLSFGFLCLLFLCPATTAQADEIAIWNFNDSDLIVDRGAGLLTTNFNLTNVAFAAGTATNARQGDVAGQALSLQAGTGNGNNGRNITLSVSTVGFSAIIISFATQGTSTGFNSNQFQYSLDGMTFVDFLSPYAPASTFGTVPLVFDLSAISGLDNNPNAAFRIVFGGATSATGNNRIDNLVMGGTTTTVPEPASVLLFGSGLTTVFALRRRRGWS